jgi:hypothetical protein
VLLSLSDEFEVVLEEIDITSDPTLYEIYRYTIPVLVIDEKIKLVAHIDAQKLRRALRDGYGPKA